MSAAARNPGMDHPHYPWSPINTRPPLEWPSGKPVALSVVVLLEHVELYPPEGTTQVQLAGGALGSLFPFPNLPMLTHWEYGRRVGIFRVLECLERLKIPPTAAIDAMTAERYPFLVEYCREKGAEIIAHGISASRIISSKMSEAEERAYIRDSRDRVAEVAGQSAGGWLGPGQSESERTPSLLDEAGFDYVLDWPNDEQPYFLDTPRRIVSVPTNFALDDAYFILSRAGSPSDFGKAISSSFDRMAIDATPSSARSLVLLIRPWLTGQPFRIHALEDALERICASGKVWAATPSDIAGAFRKVRA